MSFLKHFFKKRACVKNIFIKDNGNRFTPALVCAKCNREIGFTYFDGDIWKAFVYPRFKKYRLEIEGWVREHTKDRNYMGNLHEQEWREVLHNLKQWRENYVLPVRCEEWDGECEENSEGEESDGIGEKYIIGVDLASGSDLSF